MSLSEQQTAPLILPHTGDRSKERMREVDLSAQIEGGAFVKDIALDIGIHSSEPFAEDSSRLVYEVSTFYRCILTIRCAIAKLANG